MTVDSEICVCGGACRSSPSSHCDGAADVLNDIMIHRRLQSETSGSLKQLALGRQMRRRRKSHCELIRRSAQVLEGHALWSCTGTWARRTRLAPSLSTSRTSLSASDVTCAQNNRVNCVEELVTPPERARGTTS